MQQFEYLKNTFKILSLSTVMVLGISQAKAETFTVNKTTDSFDGCTPDDCSLREAIEAANNTDPAPDAANIIKVPASDQHYTLSIVGPNNDDNDDNSTGDLDVINYNIDIEGDGADVSIIDGGGIGRILQTLFEINPITPTPNLTLRNLGFTGGDYAGVGTVASETITGEHTVIIDKCSFFNNSAALGGGGFAYVSTGGHATIRINESSFVNNSSLNANGEGGGGLLFLVAGGDLADNDGVYVRIENTTVSGNRTESYGGGIAMQNYRLLPNPDRTSELNVIMSHSTITNNTSTSFGGGVALQTEDPDIADFAYFNSIISGNHGPQDSVDCMVTNSATLQSLNEFNIVGNKVQCGATDQNLESDPLLGDLADNGGPTPTHALLTNSPAIDLIPEASCVNTVLQPIGIDQRGISRPQGLACDVGAYEANCGDGIVQGEEVCDDGNQISGDGCAADCKSLDPIVCGNGKVEAGETCDDGNLNNGDGCSQLCQIEKAPGVVGSLSGGGLSCSLNPVSSSTPWMSLALLGLLFGFVGLKRSRLR